MTESTAQTQGGFAFDPGYLQAMAALLARIGAPEVVEEVTVDALRRQADVTLPLFGDLAEPWPDVTITRHVLLRGDGTELELRWYAKEGSAPGSAVLYAHGGGMVLGTLDHYDPIVSQYVGRSGVPALAVGYRLAPEHPHPAALDDSLAALGWLHEHAGDLGVDPARIAVMGDSGGGALAAATALAVRDRGLPPLAAQVLVYPMLDDRTVTPDPLLVPYVGWSYDNNRVAWDAVLGGEPADVAPYIAAARAPDLAGLPHTYLDTGELDTFRAEILGYAARLTAAGVSTELHVHPGLPHAFELAAPHLDVSRRALADRCRVLRSL